LIPPSGGHRAGRHHHQAAPGSFPEFSGVSNAHTKVCNARIQAVYDLVAGRLVAFSIDPHGKNDLATAPELEIREGDLVLRDRGYLIRNRADRSPPLLAGRQREESRRGDIRSPCP
jgi:hypothetical protein